MYDYHKTPMAMCRFHVTITNIFIVRGCRKSLFITKLLPELHHKATSESNVIKLISPETRSGTSFFFYVMITNYTSSFNQLVPTYLTTHQLSFAIFLLSQNIWVDLSDFYHKIKGRFLSTFFSPNSF